MESRKKNRLSPEQKALSKAIAKKVKETIDTIDTEFENKKRQAMLATNVAFLMADCLYTMYMDMTERCNAIGEKLKFEEKRYWNMIQAGVKGIKGLTRRSRPIVQERFANAANIMTLLHKHMYDRSSSDVTLYYFLQLVKTAPSVEGLYISEDEERQAFSHIPATMLEAIDKEVADMQGATKTSETKQPKKTILMMSNYYPNRHSKAGQETMFVDKIAYSEKLHTIRGNYDRWAKIEDKVNRGEMVISIRVWTDKPFRSKMAEVMRLNRCSVQHLKGRIVRGMPVCTVDEQSVPSELLAANDGLELSDWTEWIFGSTEEGTEIDMAIIQLTDFRY